jgi:tetratricopeptide (TPR) repeat protein
VVGPSATAKPDVIARYELLANLGWAYFAQDELAFAQRALEDAVSLEPQLKVLEEAETPRAQYRLALPHYYLARIYEQADEPRQALEQWEETLALLDPGWGQQVWRMEAQDRIQQLREVVP